MNADAVRDLLAKAVERAGTLRQWARDHELSAAYVSDVLAKRREPGPSICGALGVTAERGETIYRKAK
jgi:hypothetical protein